MAGTGIFTEILDGEVYKYYSDGEWKTSSSGKSVAIVNPATRKTQYKVQGMFHSFLILDEVLFVLLENLPIYPWLFSP